VLGKKPVVIGREALTHRREPDDDNHDGRIDARDIPTSWYRWRARTTSSQANQGSAVTTATNCSPPASDGSPWPACRWDIDGVAPTLRAQRRQSLIAFDHGRVNGSATNPMPQFLRREVHTRWRRHLNCQSRQHGRPHIIVGSSVFDAMAS
jgi:hypothetical protein